MFPVVLVLAPVAIGVPIAAGVAAYRSSRRVRERTRDRANEVLNGADLSTWPATVTYGGRMFAPGLYQLHVSAGGLGIDSRRGSFVGRHFYPEWWFGADEVNVNTGIAHTVWRVTTPKSGIRLVSRRDPRQPALEIVSPQLEGLLGALRRHSYIDGPPSGQNGRDEAC